MKMKDELFKKLRNFNKLSLDEQGRFSVDLARIIGRVADGVWNSSGGPIDQCVFCYVGPYSKHAVDCPVALARKIGDEL